jgi:hypothetical protein
LSDYTKQHSFQKVEDKDTGLEKKAIDRMKYMLILRDLANFYNAYPHTAKHTESCPNNTLEKD